MTNLKISVSKSALFDCVSITQHWHPVKYGTDAGYSILKIPFQYPEIVALEKLGYEPFSTEITESADRSSIVCSRHYRVKPQDRTLWLLTGGWTVDAAYG